MIRALLVLALTAVLGACAGKPLTLECANFTASDPGGYIKRVPQSAVVEAIQSDVPQGGETLPPGRLFRDEQLEAFLNSPILAELVTRSMTFQSRAEAAGPDASRRNYLLLSGGGQWGAFGAGYLRALQAKGSASYPRFDLITGVSTGALQALFVGAGQAPDANAAQSLRDLALQYLPANESEIVDRGTKVSALFRGSVANLEPLRRRIGWALCRTGAAGQLECPMIEQLGAQGAPTVLVGFVEASSGDMYYANISRFAEDAVKSADRPAAMQRAQQCITAAALASVAMPFHYQQIRVRTPEGVKTYYDGGVRQSVFFAYVQEAFATLAERREALSRIAGRLPGDRYYVLRNGPTVARPDEEIDGPSGAFSSAFRAYSLLVNQSEVASIETLRAARKEDQVLVATADGYSQAFIDPGGGEDPAGPRDGCKKTNKDAMFEPSFMRCLQALGRSKAVKNDATRIDGWIALP